MNSKRFEKLLELFMFGDIDEQDYRNRRSELVRQILLSREVDDITNAETLIDINLANDLPNVQPENQHVKPAFQVPTIKAHPEPYASNPSGKITTIVILIVAAIAAWYLSSTVENKLIDNKGEVLEISEDTNRETSIVSDEPFIIAFNLNKTWDTESISNFLVQWQSLTLTQQRLTRKSNSFNQLIQLLKEKIQQQKDLSKENDQPATRKENLLIWFASQLSISLGK